MTWSAVRPPPAHSNSYPHLHRCRIGITGRWRSRRYVALPVVEMPTEWDVGLGLAAADGTGEHAGYLRLWPVAPGEVPAGTLATMGRPGAQEVHVLSLTLPLPAGAVAGIKAPITPVAHRWDGDALILGPLPDWACPDLSHGRPPPANPGGHGPLKAEARTPSQPSPAIGGGGQGGGAGAKKPPTGIPDYLDQPPPRPGRTVTVTDRVIPRR